MATSRAPKKQGLYDPRNEHDACGVGFVVNMKGKKSHETVIDALTVLKNLAHRGACGCEVNTGDGAGILIQISQKFFEKAAKEADINLPSHGDYGIGMIYLPKNEHDRKNCEEVIERVIKEEGQEFLGWRKVPTVNDSLGNSAKVCEPENKQVFIGKGADAKDTLSFERKLYVIRRRVENEIHQHAHHGSEYFYFTSMSSQTIVYKGMLTSEQVEEYFSDLMDADMDSAIALVHSRFSTNTFPSWERAHPYRYTIHNGEINTLRGNVNWMRARQGMLATDLFGDDLKKILPVIDEDGSDSGMFDNCLEFLYLSGRSLAHSAMMMVPEPWNHHEQMDEDRRAFYEYHSCLMEPWDGPASLAVTDGKQVCALLDRNGLRPTRYYVTKDDRVIMASEVGVLEVDPANVEYKGRLEPGRMLVIDTEQGRIISDDEIKKQIVSEKPYKKWVDENMLALMDVQEVPSEKLRFSEEGLLQRQQVFAYTQEDLRMIIAPMANIGVEALGSMGTDTPLAVLSNRHQLLFNYFKQLFAQVTNPPIDAIREEIVIAIDTTIGPEGNLLNPDARSCRQIKMGSPVLTTSQFDKLTSLDDPDFKSQTFPILMAADPAKTNLNQVMDELYKKLDQAIEDGVKFVVLSDRGVDENSVPIPSLLAVAGCHHHLIRKGNRTRISLVLDSGEPREVHHYALLLGFGVSAIHPYMAYASIDNMLRKNMLQSETFDKAVLNYITATKKGVVKIMSKMGVSTVMSYRGAQIFEAVGLNQRLIDRYFSWTATRIGGIGVEEITKEMLERHASAYSKRNTQEPLDPGGQYQWRKDGEFHLFNPQSIHLLQLSTRKNEYGVYKKYSDLINKQAENLCTLRGMLKFRNQKPISIDEVEPVEAILKRFKTGAMSYGSISKEAHETLAIAMNRIGGKSNTGEGGEDRARFTPDENGDSRKSAIKQVASGRFGVTSEYLTQAQEIQIKMAQGAKPGEGGQLPGTKVYPWIAKVRLSTPGVGLISPPPHHDIYSIEDLAELIHDLKNANPSARINVKLVAEVGVGTVAAGVAKGHADVVLISGFDGGTGASPQTSIKHAGLSWELGVAETHQTLVMNNLRSRIVVEADGQLKTGRDVAVAALLGAEEFGFATAPLVTMGCIMMRVCHLNTCPVGVATQDPKLRKKFRGDPAHVVNFMTFIAQELREIMAELGFRSVNEMVGRTDKLEVDDAINHWKAKGLDLTPILYSPDAPSDIGRYCQIEQDHGLDESLDRREILALCKPALEKGEKVEATLKVKNVDRVVGTILGHEVTKKYGGEGLPEDTIQLHLLGSAGQSFGAFVPKGITLKLEGDANDYFGKGLSGGKIILYPPKASTFAPSKNIIVGNVSFYGATSGEAYVNGMAGERFCVRNSGVSAVVEGVGDHGCEYMTGGRVVVLGDVGRNFAAGMSGGIAYIFDEFGNIRDHVNTQMVEIEDLEDEDDIKEIHEFVTKHHEYTGSGRAKFILDKWDEHMSKFLKIMPRDYKQVLEAMKEVQAQGLSGDEAVLAAFEANVKSALRVGGN